MAIIIHVDMDAFFASVEVMDNPLLAGRPVIVGGAGARSVVSAASYEARKFGVHAALPIAAAQRMCPQGVFLPVRMGRYREVSDKIFSLFRRFTPLVEPLSIDEAFMDVTGSLKGFGTAEHIAALIKQEIRDGLGLTASAGVASIKFVAKIASDLHKPDGLTVVPQGQEVAFLDPLPIEKLWGVGSVTRTGLALLGIKTIGDLRHCSETLLKKKFGRHGTQLYRLSHGIDERQVVVEQRPRSIGHEQTFDEDIVAAAALRPHLLALTQKVARRLRAFRLRGRTVTVKIRYTDFSLITRSHTCMDPVDDGGAIYRLCLDMLMKTDVGNRPVRLLGVSVSHLKQPGQFSQPSLFDPQAGTEKARGLNRAIDTINTRFGQDTIVHGTLLAKK